MVGLTGRSVARAAADSTINPMLRAISMPDSGAFDRRAQATRTAP